MVKKQADAKSASSLNVWAQGSVSTVKLRNSIRKMMIFFRPLSISFLLRLRQFFITYLVSLLWSLTGWSFQKQTVFLAKEQAVSG